MSVKVLVSLTTYPTENEQAGSTPKTISSAGTTFSREYRELGSFNRGKVYFDVSAISGTGASFTATLQEQDPLSQKWVDVSNATFTASAASGDPTTHTPQAIELYGLNYRTKFVLSGTTPSVTFTMCCVAGCEVPVI